MNLCIGEFVFDPVARELRYGTQSRRLEPKASAVLARLAMASNQTVPRSDLLDACWPGAEGSDEALTQAIAQVRRAFGLAPSAGGYIQTVARTGYRLMTEVRPAPSSAATVRDRSISGASAGAGATRVWFAFTALVVAVCTVVLVVPPHALRHWFLHLF